MRLVIGSSTPLASRIFTSHDHLLALSQPSVLNALVFDDCPWDQTSPDRGLDNMTGVSARAAYFINAASRHSARRPNNVALIGTTPTALLTGRSFGP
jgi:hypothetical protein